MRRVWLLAVLAGCGDAPITVAPVVDQPVDDADATALPDLDSITLEIAHAGSDSDILTQSFSRGQPIAASDVPFGDDLVIHLTGVIGTSTVAYGRTCATAIEDVAPDPPPHLFFSRTVKFATTGIAPRARIGGTALGFLGSGIFVEGTAAGSPVLEAERFDPATGALADIGGVKPRTDAVAALIGTSPPRIVVVGGQLDGVGQTVVEALDGERRVDSTEDPHMARVGLTATSLVDGRVAVIGGGPPARDPTGAIELLTDEGTSIDVRELTATLAFPRTGHAATRIGDDVGAPVLVTGGVDASGTPVATAELFKPLSEDLADPATFHPTLLAPRTRHVATLMPDGSVLVIGGLDGTGAPVTSLELFSVDAGFSPVGDLPSDAGIVDFSATTLPDGRILLAGGRLTATGDAIATAYIVRLDPLDGSVDVVATDPLAVPRAGHQAVLLCDGTVLISGGTDSPVPAERYNPPPTDRR
ncbi:MAG TPA: kelch repeat-containing protein [Kofleriaceae bacterium]